MRAGEDHKMRRAYLATFATAAILIMSAVPFPASALGDVEVKLACSDGTTTDLTLDADTLAGLQDAVQAMTLYPADLDCTLTTTPLFSSFGGSVAQAAGNTEFVVGGGQRTFCNTNIAINGHRQAGAPTSAWGVVNQTISEAAELIPGCGAGGIMRTEVICVNFMSDTDAIVGTFINRSTGVFANAGYTSGRWVDWYFHEGKAATTTPPMMGNGPALLTQTTCGSTGFTLPDTLVHGRILVKTQP
jgi:hypothetical protein